MEIGACLFSWALLDLPLLPDLGSVYLTLGVLEFRVEGLGLSGYHIGAGKVGREPVTNFWACSLAKITKIKRL